MWETSTLTVFICSMEFWEPNRNCVENVDLKKKLKKKHFYMWVDLGKSILPKWTQWHKYFVYVKQLCQLKIPLVIISSLV